MKKRELLSPADDTASRALVNVQTAITRVKEIVSKGVSNAWDSQTLTKELNKAIATECNRVEPSFKEPFRKALVAVAKKWHYQLSQTFRILDNNLAQEAQKQPLNIELHNLLKKTPYQKQIEFRRLLDDGTNPGIPVIKDYQKSVRLMTRALSVDSPKIVTTRNGKAYVMPARLRAELAVRHAAAVENLQRLIDDGVLWCWISSHANCSPRCKDFQGKLYSLFEDSIELDGKKYGESGTVDGIPYRPIKEALDGPNGDGNGCISGYNCRHRAIEYERGSRPPTDFTETEIRKEYAIDKQQRAYENRIRQLKQEERQLRACGMDKEAKALRKKWRVLTKDYQIYSLEHNRAYYPYRYVVDREETEELVENTAAAEKNSAETVDNPVNWSIINNKQYFDKLKDFVGERRAVGSTVARITLKSLRHRDHTDREDLYLIDARTGREVAKNTNSVERLKVLPTERMKHLLEKDDGKQYILFHNHPLSSPPSVADLNSLYKNPKIKFGIIVGHNGTLYKYTAPNKPMREDDLEITEKHFLRLGYTQETARNKTYTLLQEKYDFTLEILKNEK